MCENSLGNGYLFYMLFTIGKIKCCLTSVDSIDLNVEGNIIPVL